MKRSAMVTILGCIVCLLVALLAGAQTPTKTKQKNEPAPKAQKNAAEAKQKAEKAPEPPWETLTYQGQSIQARRGFKKVTPCPTEEIQRKPEVAILRLDDNQFAAFGHNPEDFVNNFGVFSCPVDKKKGLKHLVKPKATKAATKGGDPDVVATHEPNCGGGWYEM